MRDAFHERFEFRAFRSREQGDACAFDGSVADLKNFRVGDVRDESDPFGGGDVQCRAKSPAR